MKLTKFEGLSPMQSYLLSQAYPGSLSELQQEWLVEPKTLLMMYGYDMNSFVARTDLPERERRSSFGETLTNVQQHENPNELEWIFVKWSNLLLTQPQVLEIVVQIYYQELQMGKVLPPAIGHQHPTNNDIIVISDGHHRIKAIRTALIQRRKIHLANTQGVVVALSKKTTKYHNLIEVKNLKITKQ